MGNSEDKGIRGGRGRGENLKVSCFLSFTAAEAIWRERLVRVKFFLGNCFVALQVSHVMSHDPIVPPTPFQFVLHLPFIMETTQPRYTSCDPNLTVPHPLIPPAMPTTLSKCSSSFIPRPHPLMRRNSLKQFGEPSRIFFFC